MANDKDFIVKNGVEVGKNLDINSGTVSSGAVDLSTGNFFADTTSSDTTYSFTNPSDVQAFQLEVTNGAQGLATITAMEYSDKSFFTGGSTCRDLAFNDDGTKLIWSRISGGRINTSTLSTAYDVSTAGSGTETVFSDFSYGAGITFKPDGTKFYVNSQLDDKIYEYDLSTAFDVSTAGTATSTSRSTAHDYGVVFKPDGLVMWLLSAGSSVQKYTLSTAWDTSTISASGSAISFSTYDGTADSNISHMAFNYDGTLLVTNGFSGDVYSFYALSTAYDITTISKLGTSSVATEDGTMRGVFIRPTAPYSVYGIGQVNSTVYQYTPTYTENSWSLTWPASVDWNGGSTPSDPDATKTGVFSFITPDGGTTYYGYASGENLS